MSTESYLDLYRDAAFVRRMAGGVVGEAAIEDVWQEAWREVLEHPPKAGWDVRGYVWTVARRMAGRARRGDGRRVLRERAVARPEALPSDVELLERMEVHRSLVAELMQLEEPYRRTLLLGFFEGLGAAEIARREGVSLETVRTRRKRALGLMRERLRRKHGEQREWLAGLLALAGRSAEELAPAAPRTLVVAGALTAVALLLASLAWWRGAGRELERVPVLAGGPLRAPERDLDSATVVPARVVQAPRAVDAAAELPPATPAEPWRLGGRVTDLAGRGLAGAEVTARLTGLFSVETLGSALCDADGRYELALAALTPVEVRARFLALEAFALGHRAETRELPLAELGARVEAEFVLGEGRTLEGLVLDERGAPVAKAIARVHGDAFGGEETELLAATDEHGRYRLGLAPEFTLARVEAWRADLGWGELAARALPQALDALVSAPPLVLAPRALLRGRARYLDGSPARELALVAFLVEPDGVGGWREAGGERTRPGLTRANAFSDDRGRFEFSGLCAGTFAFGPARHPPRVARGLAPAELAQAGVGEVELTLDLRRLLCEVVDAEGRPLEDVAITCTPLERAMDGELRPARAGLFARTSGARGRAAFSDLAPGLYALTASVPGWAGELEVELDGTTYETLRRIELGRAEPRAALQLSTRDGAAARFEVELATGAARQALARTWTSDAAGLVRDLPTGAFRASVRRLGEDPWSTTRVHTLTLEPGPPLALTLDAERGGRGGRLELEFRLTADAPASTEPPPTRSSWVDLGTWKDWQSARAEAVLIRAAEPGREGDFLPLEDVTPRDGWRSARPLPAGRYQLATRFAGHEPTSTWFELVPGRVNTLVVPLFPRSEFRR